MQFAKYKYATDLDSFISTVMQDILHTMAIHADPQASRLRKRSSLTSDVHGMFYHYSIIIMRQKYSVEHVFLF